ncbi:FUSC family protein [Nonomuraea roseola]|uniref:Aromatic acid exporter family protein n=1 Tax=Nonomuraea roseola TaxID=46179 RepID=A0ABV5Q969_9ACTN
MRHPESGRLSAAVRQELAYVRTQLKALGERGSHQRFELRQIAKATLAAVLAWLLADRFLPRESLWIAPATAVIMVHATVYKTLTNGLRKVAAVAAGVILAGSIGHLLGLTAFTLVLVVPPALVAARWHRMGRHGTDVATTAVLMLSFGAASQERYLLAYVMATAIGALCGGVVNSTLWPPLYRRRPDSAIERLSGEMSALLDDVAGALRDGWDLSSLPSWRHQTDRLDEHLADAAATVADSAESRRYNLRRRHRPDGDEHVQLLRALTEIGVHLHAIVRALAHLDHQNDLAATPDDLSDHYARDYSVLLELIADIVTGRIRPGGAAESADSGPDAFARAHAQADHIRDQMTTQIQAGALDHPRGWAISGSLLTDAERILNILATLRTPA